MKATITQTGQIVDGQLIGWIFDCMGTVPGIEVEKDGSVLYGGYTIEELGHLIPAIGKEGIAPVCNLEYIGQLGSEPFFHIFSCHTHPHNLFSRKKEITLCDVATGGEAS